MQIDTTRHLTYELRSLYKCAASLEYLYEWKPTLDAKRQMLVGMMIHELEAEYERLNKHYIEFANQALKTRELTK
jgi:hypothetical protein